MSPVLHSYSCTLLSICLFKIVIVRNVLVWNTWIGTNVILCFNWLIGFWRVPIKLLFPAKFRDINEMFLLVKFYSLFNNLVSSNSFKIRFKCNMGPLRIFATKFQVFCIDINQINSNFVDLWLKILSKVLYNFLFLKITLNVHYIPVNLSCLEKPSCILPHTPHAFYLSI